MKKVLFFSAWYPNRYDAMAGLFVRKHAEAVSHFANICVLFPCADNTVKDFEIITQQTGKITEVYVYYPFTKWWGVRKFSKAINYFRAFLKGYKFVNENFGRPDITHANVLTRSGFLSYFLLKTRHIPYVITEHWSRYFRERNSYKGFVRKRITEIIVRNAKCVMPVSLSLEQAMKDCNLCNDNYRVVCNVVDDFFFVDDTQSQRKRKRIIHVSCFDDSVKNISGIINVVYELSKVRSDFELIVIGTGPDYNDIVEKTSRLGLLDSVVYFLGEQTPFHVSERMKQSDFFVLFSKAENAPVVISEALACGLPVISSSVGAIPQMVVPGNGLIVPIDDETAFLNAINWMLDHFQLYKKDLIRDSAKCYSFENVGKQINSIYDQVLQDSMVRS